MSYTAKSFIIDVADNYGHINCVGIRSIDFYLNDTLINLAQTDYLSYETTKYNNYYASKYIFDASLSKTGSQALTSWQSTSTYKTNQRISCVFNSEITFDKIIVNNYHASGTTTNEGAQNVKIHISDDTITSIVYGEEISNSTLIYNGTFDQHVSSDVEDGQTLLLSGVELEYLSDFALDINTYYENKIDINLDVSFLQEKLRHCPLDLYMGKEAISNFKLDFSMAQRGLFDIAVDIYLSAGELIRTISMDIQLTDGFKKQNIGLDCLAVSTLPEIKSVYAMQLNSAIKEVT